MREQLHDAESTTPIRTINGCTDAPQVDTEAIVEVPAIAARAIYGVDDRKDWYEIDDKQLRRDADCVVSLFFDRDIKDIGKGYSELKTIPIGKKLNLCPKQKFATQPCGAFATGFLVARDVIATVGHAFHTPSPTTVDKTLFVFGFKMDKASSVPTKIKNSEISSRGKRAHPPRLQRPSTQSDRTGRLCASTVPCWVTRSRACSGVGKSPTGSRCTSSVHPKGLPLYQTQECQQRASDMQHMVEQARASCHGQGVLL